MLHSSPASVVEELCHLYSCKAVAVRRVDRCGIFRSCHQLSGLSDAVSERGESGGLESLSLQDSGPPGGLLAFCFIDLKPHAAEPFPTQSALQHVSTRFTVFVDWPFLLWMAL